MTGKGIRINRLKKNGLIFCVPLDHGITNVNIEKLSDIGGLAQSLIDSKVSAIIVHKGLVRYLPDMGDTGLIVHLSASTENVLPVRKRLVCNVAEAISLGADAVSIHVNIGNDYEKEMLTDFASVSRECERWGVPLLAMMYVRDNNNQEIHDVSRVKHAVRIAAELGADLVKISTGWSKSELEEITDNALIPILVAGGEVVDDNSLKNLTEQIVTSGVAGVSYGRNVFMADDPSSVVATLADIIYK